MVERLVQASGKLSLLDRMLAQWLKEGHRILIFSQFTRVLDILEDYMTYRSFKFCRLDGNTAMTEREHMIDEFSKEGTSSYMNFGFDSRLLPVRL